MTAQEQYIRWMAELNLMELAATQGIELQFDKYRRDLESADFTPLLRVTYLLHVGRGYHTLGQSGSRNSVSGARDRSRGQTTSSISCCSNARPRSTDARRRGVRLARLSAPPSTDVGLQTRRRRHPEDAQWRESRRQTRRARTKRPARYAESAVDESTLLVALAARIQRSRCTALSRLGRRRGDVTAGGENKGGDSESENTRGRRDISGRAP